MMMEPECNVPALRLFLQINVGILAGVNPWTFYLQERENEKMENKRKKEMQINV